jgi:hypothetical protein
MEVLGFVGNLMDTSESGTDGKVYVTKKGMLCRMKADGDCARVTRPDLEVDIADRGVEGAGVGVGNVAVGGRDNSPRCGRRMIAGRG